MALPSDVQGPGVGSQGSEGAIGVFVFQHGPSDPCPQTQLKLPGIFSEVPEAEEPLSPGVTSVSPWREGAGPGSIADTQNGFDTSNTAGKRHLEDK